MVHAFRFLYLEFAFTHSPSLNICLRLLKLHRIIHLILDISVSENPLKNYEIVLFARLPADRLMSLRRADALKAIHLFNE